MAAERYDVAVVGAGIVGAACAMELARVGRSVVILEAVDVASDTSCRAMGHVGAYDDSPAQLEFTRFACQLWADLSAELPAEVEYVRRGALWVAETEEEMAEVERKHGVYTAAHVPTRVVDARTLSDLEPNLREGLPGALLVPGDAVVDAAEATRYLVRRAQSFGAELRVGAAVRGLPTDGPQLKDGTIVRANRTVLATGWQAPRLVPSLPIRPRKGHIALTLPRPGFVRHQVSEVGYVRGAQPENEESITFSFQPRTSGKYLIGATRQYVGDSTEVDPRIIERLLARARAFLPAVDQLGIERTWAGLRPAGPGAVPIIGPMPGLPHLVLALAHEGIGITTSIATGRMVTETIEGRPTSLPIEPYLPARAGVAAP
ncbi:MAG: FAD-dependent oxidoreductase [Thermoplasmata archaeon]